MIADTEGFPDALTARFTPKIKELKHGLPVHVRAKNINATVTPTFNADETGEKAIVKGNNLTLAIGDIAGAGHWLEMQYDEALDKWILQNPAKGISPFSGVPVGTIEYFAAAIPPAGYLKANGVAVGRATYPELFAAIGTSFGGGDGSTTFNLPDLINRFAQGSYTPGQKISAGLPNLTGRVETDFCNLASANGVFNVAVPWSRNVGTLARPDSYTHFNFDASRSNPIYGASDTVQPPALTLLPCIKAFDAISNPGLIDITELASEITEVANDISLKANSDLSNITRIPITYVPSGTIPVGGVLIINNQNSGSIHVPDYGEWYGHIMRYTADSANSGSIGVTYQAGIWPSGTLVIDIPNPGAYRAEHVYFSAIRTN